MANDDKLKELRAKRGAIKSKITKLETWANDDAIPRDEFDISTRQESLATTMMTFETVQTELEELCVAEESERVTIEERVIDLKAQFKRLLAKCESASPSRHDFTDLDSTQLHNSMHVEVASAIDVPLPVLPKFNGDDYTTYPNFINQFTSLVDQNNVRGLTKIKKFSILLSALEGKALNAISHLLLTNKNYDTALAILHDRFYKKNLIFESLVKRMVNIPRGSDSQSLRKIIDHVTSCLHALEGLPATSTQIGYGVLMHLVLRHVDERTAQKWEEQTCDKSDELPNWKEFAEFMNKRANVQESMSFIHRDKRAKEKGVINKVSYTTTRKGCASCSGSCPSIIQCPSFIEKSPTDRFQWAKTNSFCIKCLNKTPHSSPCVPTNCNQCKGHHHSMLHFTKQTLLLTPTKRSDSSSSIESQLSLSSNQRQPQNQIQLLGTAIVKIKATDGTWIPGRALLDSGSMSHFVTQKFASKLKLKLSKTMSPIVGLFTEQEIKSKARINLKSTSTDYEDQLDVLVLPEFNHFNPSTKLDTTQMNIPHNISLADPTFYNPQPVDIIIGVGRAYKLLQVGQIQLQDGLLLQKTQLGWIVVGELPCDNLNNTKLSLLTGTGDEVPEYIDELITRFWELDKIPAVFPKWSPLEKFCESHFMQNTIRDSEGRFVVRLPFHKEIASLGDSYELALMRLKSVQQRMARDKEFKRLYCAFMEEYEGLGHMEEVTTTGTEVFNYLAHHGVIKLDSSSTKLRVVFDGSAKTSSGVSLNDIMPHGPTIQPSLFLILLQFRFHKYGLAGDIPKMYRQMKVHPDDQRVQCILWQREGDAHPKTFKLTTVTYGTSAAAYLAIRCVDELAKTDTEYPKAAEALRKRTYVDNTLTGAETPTEVTAIRHDLKRLLAKGCMDMRKWCSNSPEVMQLIPQDEQETFISIADDEVIKTLGLNWNPASDYFIFQHNAGNCEERWTKRKIVSFVAKIFDPLGFVGPVVSRLKIFVQNIWLTKLAWDESLTQEMITTWQKLLKTLPLINTIKCPRYVFYDLSRAVEMQLHGFADASGKAYGAVFYVRCTLNDGQIVIRLLCSKSRVAPIKKVTLPRLELLSAYTLANLYDTIWPLLQSKISKTYCWLDAEVALTWVTHSPHRYNDFVANRVTVIQDLTVNCIWRHVPGELNPADIISRGTSPAKLALSDWWFTGPEFLYKAESEWIFSKRNPLEIDDSRLETKPAVLSLYAHVKVDLVRQYQFHGTLYRIQKTFAYVARFVNAVKYNKKPPNELSLSINELEQGLSLAIRIAQAQGFYNEYRLLKEGKDLPASSALLKLATFMDNNGLMRVGGRLNHAPDLDFNEKHPMLLPKNHPLVHAIFYFYHWNGQHAGPKTMLATVRRKYWPIGGSVVANQIYNRCVPCTIQAKRTFQQVMGDLPETRVSQMVKCFNVVGIDLFGPITVRQQGRGAPRVTMYGMVVVCFATRAIQLHYVKDSTTDSAINALIRFMSRSGRPRKIVSDNGTNFHGTNNVFAQINWQRVDEWCRMENRVEWKFIPSRTPSWGGLWETQIRLAKRQLTKVMGGRVLHFDALITLLAQVEAVLNSRPITPISTNPSDGQVLTPAHFLVGQPIITLPDPIPNELPKNCHNLVKTWQLLCEIKQQWWQRWKTEVRQHLQGRAKWHSGSKNIRVGKVVLMVDTEKNPYAWTVATITNIFPGRDGRVRSVEVTANKTEHDKTERKFIRGVIKLVPVPCADDEEENQTRSKAD